MSNPSLIATEPRSVVSANEVIEVFNREFEEEFLTHLCGGAQEPFYQVSDTGSAVIYFREDFVASALHEVAHWCLAGADRRRKDDYGYWYEGVRDLEAQKRFEAVEARPQALEWIFSQVLCLPFRASADNLALKDHDTRPFRMSIREATRDMLLAGLPRRAQRFAVALHSLVAPGLDWSQIQTRICLEEMPD